MAFIQDKTWLARYWLILLPLGTLFFLSFAPSRGGSGTLRRPSCRKIEPLKPVFDGSVHEILHDKSYKQQSIKRLSEAVQIKTDVGDYIPDPEESLEPWLAFIDFHKYLEKTFPLVHEHLQLEKVNQLGLLYTWKGTNETLKPAMFMAHQDVVPVNEDTIDQWKYAPFSGYYESSTDLLWGRGSNDCKNLLLSEFEAIEKLLEDGYATERTILLAIGFDEESGGKMGSGRMAPILDERYGRNGVLIIIDEGEGIVEVEDGLYIATPIPNEKGTVTLELHVVGKGGHSSAPPDHTTIGVAAQLVNKLEDNPFPFQFKPDNPIFGLLTCTAEHSTTINPKLKEAILNAGTSSAANEALSALLGRSKGWRDTIRTTQAIDIINGGTKINALPETVRVITNYRIDMHDSVEATVQSAIDITESVALKQNYGVLFNGTYLLPPTENGYIEVIQYIPMKKPLQPSPVSPSDGPLWDVLAGTIQNLFENDMFPGENKELYVTTGVFPGNTDTKHYWNLSDNIYRFVGSTSKGSLLSNVHSVNENMNMKSHLSAIAFVYEFIINVSSFHDE
ncbi:M20 family metallopeptidase KNAG_0G02320 [Huiozyma naganishii CBS 8797]|uniref:Peptidase M20 dimerisation domain-containing protein n=1 Tax=Huiozyma naganishii (strain ATCC MYA-139 / BCRC 22969 / CBS 8797 / KCTC 17520 / NBRC 10181 / NCYC 3082 / Yp74L-3) TaxID=1071383 RepID=J7R8U2_HUIN7|nr:hypothetical protein KNAG_0G02320 [Kazachstania naganishii CBS 8797]CCK71290.1 hypothetical protein KNAG_0G02320 [Kazachstania naganishii CBS 8797]